ncbi:MAG: hypothetical protein ACKPFE_13785, partial [Dolichospermum sp.]
MTWVDDTKNNTYRLCDQLTFLLLAVELAPFIHLYFSHVTHIDLGYHKQTLDFGKVFIGHFKDGDSFVFDGQSLYSYFHVGVAVTIYQKELILMLLDL